ncbi:hypothetical protein DACRYDRAFT_99491 [Dacryopinax primogenitus]|uniref:CFEM domain-containing protein n=1 Tax=Dacryopinax primogenitus (strain DJM 731) TaxID=1858805 RepID=M5GAV6_DACPD|nr:uncharacterized protein DACRYDRAFT_99491 [Dacryopinax primogenitus]EJU03112.1 hypothetical protein DACRYDRAFT_99491 [Dacryopinax primogenitus]
MHSSILAVLSLAALAAAQDIPACAETCLATVITTGNSTCAVTDIACFCDDPTFLSDTLACLQTTCSASDLQTAIQAAQAECAAAGVSVNPAQVTPASGSGNSTGASSSPTAGSASGSPSLSANSSSSASSSSSGSSTSQSPSSSPTKSSAAMLGASVDGVWGALLAFAGIAFTL